MSKDYTFTLSDEEQKIVEWEVEHRNAMVLAAGMFNPAEPPEPITANDLLDSILRENIRQWQHTQASTMVSAIQGTLADASQEVRAAAGETLVALANAPDDETRLQVLKEMRDKLA